MNGKDALALARKWCADWGQDVDPVLLQAEFLPTLAGALEADSVEKHQEPGFTVHLREPFDFGGKRITELRVFWPEWKPGQTDKIRHAQKSGERAGARASLAIMNGLPPSAGDLLGEFDLTLLGVISTFVFNMR